MVDDYLVDAEYLVIHRFETGGRDCVLSLGLHNPAYVRIEFYGGTGVVEKYFDLDKEFDISLDVC